MKKTGVGGAIWVLGALLLLLPVTVTAAPIYGTFNIDGTITVSNTPTTRVISWESNGGVASESTIASAGLTGSFTGLGNTEIAIATLTDPPNVVNGGGFTAMTFITFIAAVLPDLDINYIYPGVYSSTDCATIPAMAGQTCTLADSPFSFTNLGQAGDVTGSTGGFSFSGLTSDGLSKWTANFTSQFSIPFQDVLAELESTGSITNTYSATVVVTAIPEPATQFLLLGAVFSLIGLSRKLRRT